ncbi:unnamed protein product, partial [Vitis vinifera]
MQAFFFPCRLQQSSRKSEWNKHKEEESTLIWGRRTENEKERDATSCQILRHPFSNQKPISLLPGLHQTNLFPFLSPSSALLFHSLHNYNINYCPFASFVNSERFVLPLNSSFSYGRLNIRKESRERGTTSIFSEKIKCFLGKLIQRRPIWFGSSSR